MACLLLAFATFAQADDECLGCADRIKAAVDYCNVSIKSRPFYATKLWFSIQRFSSLSCLQESDAVTIECVVDALGAAEECLECICQIIDIVDNHPQLCNQQISCV